MAGTLKLNNIQLGDSVTATNNFSLVNNQDGSITLARGNVGATSQDVLKIDATGNVTTVNGVPLQKMLSIPAKATTSGTFVDFSPADGTGIPSWAKKITVNISGVSTNGTSPPIIQLGTSSGFETTGYIGNFGYISGANAAGLAGIGAGIPSGFSTAATNRLSTITFVLHSGFLWMVNGIETADALAASLVMISGRKTLAGTLERIRLTTVNGTDTFDAGSVSLLIEGY